MNPTHTNEHLKQFAFVGFLLAAIATGTLAQSTEPSREPVLRIETGMHTAGIGSIGVDRAGRFLVTASIDKTARVWELETGRLLRVLRVPIGDGAEGQLFAAAISPDGNMIALGGHTGNQWDGQHCVYLFDRETGRLMRRLTGSPGEVNYLRFSPDGTLFAAALFAGGVVVWRTSDWTEVGRDSAYGESSGADFDRAGRLVTSSGDGELRLYDRQMRRLTKRKAPGGKVPSGVRFSPDGLKVAVGYFDLTRVDVLSGDTLAPLYTPDTSGSIISVTVVSWSMDGMTLFASGGSQDKGNYIRRWGDAGLGRYVDTSVAQSTTDIVPLPSGGIVYGAFKPAWGILDQNHKQTSVQTGQIATYVGNQSGLFSDATASTIQFPYQPYGRSPAIFDLADRDLRLGEMSGAGLQAPLTVTSGLSITDWKWTYLPSVNGAPLKLERGENSISLAIAADGNTFLLGTGLFIRLFNRSRQELWRAPALGGALAVNISGNNRLALAACGDGTIRWYRMTDGKELLAFFPHADRKRWVLWTPSGYYDSSPGAEELIGWHVNTAKDQAADFFPVGQFRSTYYRPGVISKVLQTSDEVEALRLADKERGRVRFQGALIVIPRPKVAQMLPPVVEIASPSDNSEVSASEVTIRYSLRTPSGEAVTNVRALVDGRPVTGNRQLTREDASASGVRELKLTVPERDSEVSIIAENRFAASVPVTIRLRWRGAVPATRPSADTFVIQPKLYVLAIGVSQYQNPSYSLKFAAKDAQDFAAVATIQKGLLYRDVVVKVLTNEHATKDEILDGLDWIRKETTSKDVAMVFFAGHGLNDQNGVYYFLPYNTDLEKLLRTGVPFTDIKNTVQSLAGKTLFFIDTCHSGYVLGGRRGLADDLNGIINELSSAESGAVVFAASTGNQYSLEDAKWNNGAFTKALVEGFTGRADYIGKGKITINMLDLYLSERVKELTGGRQTPTTAKPNTIQDFPIAVMR